MLIVLNLFNISFVTAMKCEEIILLMQHGTWKNNFICHMCMRQYYSRIYRIKALQTKEM